ncbi:MAG: DNA recombination protein RmuC [Planctomycetota bacterium]
MVTAIVALSVASLVLALAVVWALAGRTRALTEAAGLRADAARLGQEVDRAREETERAREHGRAELERAEGARDAGGRRVVELSEELARLRERLESAARELGEREQLEKRFTDAFKALSAEALKSSRAEFIEQAKPVFESAQKDQAELVKPIGETLRLTREKLEEIEKARIESFAKIGEQVQALQGASGGLRDETARLTNALSRPEVRGQYGEIQLRRVAELAGMTGYCDFSEQTSTRDDAGNLLRPDMVVRLPNERVIAIDAKTNTYAYLEAVNARDDTEREQHLERFARHVAEQAKKLSDKRYWSHFDKSPDFVVMFVPGDHFIDAALSRRADLLETAAQQGVILASPSTLIGLLRAVALGWREHSLTEQARELLELGRELHERASVAFDHAGKLGDSIRQSVDRYNRLVGSIDTRLLPTLRRFEDAGAKGTKALVEPKRVDQGVRTIESGETGEVSAALESLGAPRKALGHGRGRKAVRKASEGKAPEGGAPDAK